MNIFEFINENFVKNTQFPSESLNRVLDKGVILPSNAVNFEPIGIELNDGSFLYVLGRRIEPNIYSNIVTAFPEVTNYLPNAAAPTSYPTDFQDKISTTKTKILKFSSFPGGINIDEGTNAVPA
jgi:hypothetical protein